MGNSPNKTLIIWIDKYINNEENKSYQKELNKIDDIQLECFVDVDKGIDYVKTIKFRKTIIITSGRLYPEFYKAFKDNLLEINIIPNIIIFTGDAKRYYSEKAKELPLKDPFYNNGGAVDHINFLMDFVETSKNKYNSEFDGNEDEIKSEELEFEFISDKNELILPMYYTEYLKVSTEEQIKQFNIKIFEDKENIESIKFLFSQLAEAGNIPLNLLTMFWLRAYSIHSSFNENLNKSLLNCDYNDYLPIIQKFYESVDKCNLCSCDSTIYKGIIVERKKMTSFIKEFNNKRDSIPKAILYGKSFFSFYKDEYKVKKLKDSKKAILQRFNYFIKLVLEKPNNLRLVKDNAIINKEISYFESDDEILFFPFSCFEIKKIEQINDQEIIMTLNYLDKYTELIKPEEGQIFAKIPENDFSRLVFESGIIDEKKIIIPNWYHPKLANNSEENNLINNNFNDQSQITNVNNNNNIAIINSNNEYIAYQNNPINNIYANINNSNLLKSNADLNMNFINYNIPQNLNVVKGIDNFSLLSKVKETCISSIKQFNYNNSEELQNIIQNNLIKINQGNLTVKLYQTLTDNFSGFDINSLMIFQYHDSSNNFFIYIYSLSN